MVNIKIGHREVINTGIRSGMSLLILDSISRIICFKIKSLSMKRLGLKSVTATFLIYSSLITIEVFGCVKLGNAKYSNRTEECHSAMKLSI
jgi:hypothetical protein